MTDNTDTKHALQDKMHWKRGPHSAYDVIVITQGESSWQKDSNEKPKKQKNLRKKHQNNKNRQLENLGSRSNDSTHKVLAASLIASGFAGGLSIIKALGYQKR
ncbi:MAG: hypothetical protein K2Q45_10590 [Nitrosomonas sp.]|nr:hypothetical protein [Nitrosomonas sp.]